MFIGVAPAQSPRPRHSPASAIYADCVNLSALPGIHVFAGYQRSKAWMAGTSPAMTTRAMIRHCHRKQHHFKGAIGLFLITVIPGRE